MLKDNIYPFTAVVGQEEAKKALLIALVNRRAGGLLIGGAKGTAKSVLARSVQSLIGAQRMLTLPLNVTEDMLFGSIDLEAAVSLGEKRFSPGILARATDNILYIDEANLLRQELLTAALDANSAGINNVERDGISCSHEVRTTVIATMNPEEGTLPGHILDRFGMYADMQALQDIGQRVEVIQRALAYSNNTLAFCEQYAEETAALAAKVKAARELLPQVEVSDAMLMLAAQLCSQAFCAGHRAEFYLLEAARAIAAMAGRAYVLPKDVEEAAQFVLPHRMRKPPEQQPEEQEQHTDGYLAIPEEWVDGECFLLRAYGDSMIDLGIEQGDLILVKRKSEATDGQIVVALTEEGNTLKRIRFEDGKPVLYAENHTYTDSKRIIHPKQLSIQGIALKLIKDLK